MAMQKQIELFAAWVVETVMGTEPITSMGRT